MKYERDVEKKDMSECETQRKKEEKERVREI